MHETSDREHIKQSLKGDRDKVKDYRRKIFYASTYEHAKEAIEIFKKQWGNKYPSALEILQGNIGVPDILYQKAVIR